VCTGVDWGGKVSFVINACWRSTAAASMLPARCRASVTVHLAGVESTALRVSTATVALSWILTIDDEFMKTTL